MTQSRLVPGLHDFLLSIRQMKPISAALLALSFGCLLFGACERHSFEETKRLQELQQPHGEHGDHGKEGGDHAGEEKAH